MPTELLEAMIGAEHEQVQILQDLELGMLAFLAIHDTSRGPAFGGVRRHRYRSPREGLADVLRLSQAMSFKCALIGVDGGGGKCVLVDHPMLDVEGAYRRIGEYVENLGGRYFTGPDVGTGETELGYLAATTRFVTVPGPEGPGDLAVATARGVMAGLRAVLRFLARRNDRYPRDPVADGLEGLHFCIQGLGGVGLKVARQLHAAGAQLTLCELDTELLERSCEELGAEHVGPGAVFDVDCDVFVPCALGGIVHDLSVGRFRCDAIAGSANNVLAGPEHGEDLARRGILLAPDFVCNSGALILGANFHLTGDREQGAAIDRIEHELLSLFERAEREDESPSSLADRISEERLSSGLRRPFFPDLDTKSGASDA
jgi:leucine dehydrogenase